MERPRLSWCPTRHENPSEKEAHMTTTTSLSAREAALQASRDRVLGATQDRETLLAQATGVRMIAAWALVAAPRDPVRHLEAAHDRARNHLVRLTDHEASREVISVMTNELFDRLTAEPPAPLRRSAGVHRYTYTPRKVLRRVLDHFLDHLNQIDQWLWRIDQSARLLVQRAGGLTAADLDWQPPDRGWPLRRVFHHVARSELLYSASLDEALHGEDPRERYVEACRRLGEAMQAADARGDDPAVVYPGLYGVLRRPDEVIDDALLFESELLAG